MITSIIIFMIMILRPKERPGSNGKASSAKAGFTHCRLPCQQAPTLALFSLGLRFLAFPYFCFTFGKIRMETELSPGPGKSEWLALAWVPGVKGPALLFEVLSHELWLQAPTLLGLAWCLGGLEDNDQNKTQRNSS